jgi:hypothetical protein
MRVRNLLVRLLGSVLSALLLLVVVAVPASAAEVLLRPPTSAPVLDPFRPPDGPYGSGNRGIEYDTSPGDPIVAAGPGTVAFAGPVAGQLYITIDHGGGLKSSYSYVEAILVARGDVVEVGEHVGVAGPRFHFGTRIDGVYVDPASLFGVRVINVELVEGDLAELAHQFGDLVERSERLHYLELGGAPIDGGILSSALRAGLRSLGVGSSGLLDHIDPAALMATLDDFIEPLADRDCSPASTRVTPPAERRIALVVDGLNSSSEGPGTMSTLDLGTHGYEAIDVVRFSYAGGIVPPLNSGWASALESSPYTSADTFDIVASTVEALGRLLTEIAATQPGVPIDVYGHSLGGLAARLALAEIDLRVVPIGVAMTFASPHQGTPSAEIIESIDASHVGVVADGLAGLVGAEGLLDAAVIDDLSTDGYAAQFADVAFPPSIHAVTIGARGDVAVPANVAWAPGARHVVLDASSPFTAHSAVVGLETAGREVALALRGAPPACEGVLNRFFDWAMPGVIDASERGVAAVLDAGTLLDGPSGSDSSQSVTMAIDSVRAIPGRFGVPHESVTGRHFHGSTFHEAVVGSRRPLRSSDPSMEPEDEAIHPRRTLRHPHRRSAPDAQPPRVVLRVHPRSRRQRRHGAVHRHEEAGSGLDPVVRRALQHAVHQRALARRHAHQLPDHLQARQQDAGLPPHA